jgi:serine phosphatase RsbU (regulator of sigma subunit)
VVDGQPNPDGRPSEDSRGGAGAFRGHGAALVVLVVGLAITIGLVGTSWILNTHNESRLLDLQGQQVGTVLAAAIPSTQTPLELGVEQAQATNGDVARFDQFASSQVVPHGSFTSLSLWRLSGARVQLVASAGSTPQRNPTSAGTQSVIARAFRVPTFVVTEIKGGPSNYLGFATSLPGTGERYAIYAERPLPADKRASVARNSAFSDLNYAIYLGRSDDQASLLATDLSQLPIEGRRTTVRVPFGDNTLTTVVTAKSPLAGTVTTWLPWIFAVLGVLLTIAAVWITERLVRRRRGAERAEVETRHLYDRLEMLYGQQRTIAETLQKALLPQVLPSIPGLEVAVQYLPGSTGVDIGGDWYSLVDLDDGRFVFVIGDVSGRGLSAASTMAALQFTSRAYAMDGDSPAEILEKCSKQLDVDADGHFATVLVGSGDVERHEIVLANAGHLNPFLIDGEHGDFVSTQVGVPVGISGEMYEPVPISVPRHSTLIAFTDGLVERRKESLDTGLKRLAGAAVAHRGSSLNDMVTEIATELGGDVSEDDIAILAVRWRE